MKEESITLEWKIKVINDLIKEDRDACIKDYLELVDEVRKISEAANTIEAE